MKVTVIGASISGLYSAYLLAKKGIEVEVYERVDRLGYPPRTLIVTNKLNEVLDFVPEEAIVNRIKNFEIFSQSKKVRIELSVPDLVIERKKLVRLLARQAEKNGAKIFLGHQFQSFYRNKREILVSLRNLQTGETVSIPTNVLVGADGASSAVAQSIFHNGYYPTTLLQARISLPGEGASDTCQVWFDSNYTKFFFWSIPESKDLSTVGLIADDDRQAKASLEIFLEEKGLKPLEFQQSRVPLHQLSWMRGGDTCNRGVFLVGDSAAQVKVTTVGGVVTGLYGAKALARALLNGGHYQRELRSLHLELDLHLLIRKILNRFNNDDYDRLLERVDGRLKEIFRKRTRDELRSFILKMFITEPRLLHLALKALLRSII